MKTGQAKLDFNNLLLTKQYSVDGQINTITLAGSVEGKLTEAPTKVQLPTSQPHQLKWSITPSDKDGLNLLSNYQKLSFTNHNQAAFQLDELSIGIQNNQVQYVNLTFPNLIIYPLYCGVFTLKCQNGTYNPLNYEVTFHNTKINGIFFGDLYLNGSTGL